LGDVASAFFNLAIALGNMVIAWANAETALVHALAHIADIHPNMASVTYYRVPTFESRVKVIQALIEEWQVSQASRDALSDAVKQLSDLASTRNNWIHRI
jgi:aminoglycoside/choline kinase family phosphotransferase